MIDKHTPHHWGVNKNMKNIHIFKIGKKTEKAIENEFRKLSDEKGKINCIEMMALARHMKIPPSQLGKVADNTGYRVKNCELGEFGNKPTDNEIEQDVYSDIKRYTDKKNRIKCKDAWTVAEKYGLKKVRSALRSKNIDVIYCQLGCFREKKRPRLKIKTKIWIENKSVGMVFGKGKAEILQLIESMGSIAAVADYLGVSYKKVWNHVQMLEKNMGKKYVITSRGRNKGGSIITKEAEELIDKFTELQEDIEEFANKRFVELFYSDRKYINLENEKNKQEKNILFESGQQRIE